MKKPTQKGIERKTHHIDATGEVLGRLATRIALLLRGKNKPTYMPHIDAGDVVFVSNIEAIVITGQKKSQKVYHHYSGYPGGLKTKKIAEVMTKKPGDILRRAVLQMLPPTRLRPSMMKRLHIQLQK